MTSDDLPRLSPTKDRPSRHWTVGGPPKARVRELIRRTNTEISSPLVVKTSILPVAAIRPRDRTTCGERGPLGRRVEIAKDICGPWEPAGNTNEASALIGAEIHNIYYHVKSRTQIKGYFVRWEISRSASRP
jgi:hypothetical protein